MNGTDAWRAAWARVTERKPVTLVRIDCPLGTIYASTDLVRVGGQVWEPLLLPGGTISAKGALLSTDVNLATASFALADRECSFTGGLTLAGWVAQQNIVNAPVTIWLGERSLDFSDYMQRFPGVVQVYTPTTGRIAFTCMQDDGWNRPFTPRVVTRAEFPGAPEESIGAALPIVIGKVTGSPLRPPFPNAYDALQQARERIAGGQRLGGAVLVDTGRGGGTTNPKARVMVAGHEVKQVGTISAFGTSCFLGGGDGKAHLIEPASGDFFNGATGAGWLFSDAQTAWAPVYPNAIDIAHTTCQFPRDVLDPWNEVRHAHLVAGSAGQLSVTLPDIVPNGALTGHSKLLVIYRTSPGATGLMFSPDVNAVPFASSPMPASTAITKYDYVPGVLDSWFVGSKYRPTVFFQSGSGWADVFLIGVGVEYVPRQDALGMQKVTEMVTVPRPAPRGRDPRPRGTPHTVTVPRDVMTNITELRGAFYANVWGFPDDADGKFTGTPTTRPVVERPCDAAHLVLSKFGGAAEAEFALESGVVGSFTDARALLKTTSGLDMVHGLSVVEDTDVQTVLGWIAAASAAHLWRSEFDGRWRFLPLTVAPPVTYGRALRRADMLDPSEGPRLTTPTPTDVPSGMRIQYGYDALSRGYLHETAITENSSSAGHLYRNLRDQSAVVTLNVNDKFDLSPQGTVTLAPGDYDAPGLLGALHAGMSGFRHSVALGALVVRDVNDRVPCFSGGSNYTGFLPPGLYSFPALATALAAVINALGMGIPAVSCTFNATTRLFSILNAPALRFYSNPTANCAALYGFPVQDYSASANTTGTFAVEAERLTITFDQSTTALWRTGTNGLDGTAQSAAEVLGADWHEDGAAGFRYVSIPPKGTREHALAASNVIYGRKRIPTFDGRAIYDSDTALELRNRLVALLAARPPVTFASETAADMERGDVFEYDADMDLLRPYAAPSTDGSWAGKRFLALESTQYIGPQYHTEVGAVDLTAAP